MQKEESKQDPGTDNQAESENFTNPEGNVENSL